MIPADSAWQPDTGDATKAAMTYQSTRFVVVEGSQSAHCCFTATVVDTNRPTLINGEHYKGQFDPVCECFETDDAHRIAAALNKADWE